MNYQRAPATSAGTVGRLAQPSLAVLLLVAILAQALFALVRRDLVPFPFFSARHIIKFYKSVKINSFVHI
ncbi:MAG: hypothetical protein IPJ00_00670 [Saprospirales bacterium]|jgi:hypothetical protein|nr:hypothetical protein [Saprospirales bacterium]